MCVHYSLAAPPGYVRLHTNYGDLNLELYCDQVSAEVLLFPDNTALSFMSILSCRSPRLARTFSDTAEKATTMTPVSGRHICTLTQYIDHTHTHTVFHRSIRNFMVSYTKTVQVPHSYTASLFLSLSPQIQGGDPTGTGKGASNMYYMLWCSDAF